MKVLIGAGYTGGHLCLADAIVEHLQDLDTTVGITIVGTTGQSAAERALSSQHATYRLSALPFDRHNPLRNVATAVRLFTSLVEAARILRREKPDVVVGVGAYPTVPLLGAAVLGRIPTLVVEPNELPGMANRFVGRWADRICTAGESASNCFPPHRTLVTGTPVRKQFLVPTADPRSARVHFGLDPAAATLLVSGGSLGSGAVNDAMIETWPALVDRGIQVLWQTGDAFFLGTKSRRGHPQGAVRCEMLPHIDRMDLAMAAADVVLSAAGAITIAELAARGKASILSPLGAATENHQHYNAQPLAQANACILIPEADLPAGLTPAIVDLFEDTSRRETMAREIRKFSRPEAGTAIAAAIVELA